MYQKNQQSNETLLKKLGTRRNIYTLIVIIGLVGIFISGSLPESVGNVMFPIFMMIVGVFAGCGMACINQYRFEKSGGRKKGGGLWWLFLLIFGLIVIPIITVMICSKIPPLARLVLGVKIIK